MANTYALFEEGEPINVQKLNDLVDAVNSSAAKVDGIFKTSSGLQSSLQSAKLTITETGKIQIKMVNGVGSVKIVPTIDPAYSPMIFVSPSMVLNEAGDSAFACSAHGTYPNITIDAVAGPKFNSSVWVNWMAVGHKDITA
jgi:hypothetical protein